MILGGLGLNWQANKELIPYTADSTKPFSGFWQGVAIGLMIGLWTGVNYGTWVTSGWNMFEKMGWWVIGYPASKDDDTTLATRR